MTEIEKYLFVTIEAGGNLPPVLGAARRMVALGHDVRVLGEPCIAPAIEGVGARFVPFREHFTRTSRSEEIFFDWEARSPAAALKASLERVVLGPAAAVVASVKAELDRDPATALVVDWLLPGAAIVGEARGVPTAMLFHCVSLLPAEGRPAGPFAPARGPLGRWRDRALTAMFRRMVGSFTERYNRVRRAQGLGDLKDPLEQYARAERCLYQTTEAFDFKASRDLPNARYVGPVLDDPDWVGPTWQSPFAPADERPLVLLSLSSTFQDQRAVLQTAIDALGRLDVRGLVTLGPAMERETFRHGESVRIVASAPHAAVLPGASVMISHCGHGSLMRALAAGVPIVALPMGRDQDANAARVVTRGLGVKPRRTAASIASAVTRVLADGSFRSAALAMRERILEDVRADRLTRELAELPARAPGVAAAGA